MATEEPAHTIVLKEDDLELRDYAPMIIAEVSVTGDRSDAVSAGFRPLADYIFGANTPQREIAMTAPVTQTPAGEEIAMTAPVTQTPGGSGRWTVAFVMPAEWTMETLPAPQNPAVRLVEKPAERRAVITFSGFRGPEKLAEKTAELEAFIARSGHVAAGPATYAYYDPPWVLPFLRRNEIWMTVRPATSDAANPPS